MLRCLSVFVLLLTLVPVLLADSPATVCSFVEYSADRTFVFAMLAPGSETECRSQGPERLAEAKEIRSKYPVSGMYQTGDTAKLAWPIEEQWFAFKVHVLNDGKNLIRMGPWARDLRDEAFSLVREGKIVRTVLINELIRSESSVKRTVSHFFWMENAVLDQNSARFTVKTVEGLTYEFDIATAELIAPDVIPIIGEQPVAKKCFGTSILFFGLLLMLFRRPR